jgi:hypothetical protein
MNAYVMTDDGIRVVPGAGSIDVQPDDVVVIRGEDPAHRALAAVRLSWRLWVALGDEPPAAWPLPRSAEDETSPALAATPADGDWPFEPPPDVDSEG